MSKKTQVIPDIKYAPEIKELWELAGKIGCIAEDDFRYKNVYIKLSEALNVAEEVGLIYYE